MLPARLISLAALRLRCLVPRPALVLLVCLVPFQSVSSCPHAHAHTHAHTHTHTHTQGVRTDLKYRKTGSVAVSLEYRPMEGLLEVHVVSAQFRSSKVACFLCPFSLSLSLSLSLARSLSPPRRTGLLVPPVFCSVFRRRCHARQQRQQRQGVPGVGGRRECGMEGVAGLRGLQYKTGSVWE